MTTVESSVLWTVGKFHRAICLGCGARGTIKLNRPMPNGQVPPCDNCGGPLSRLELANVPTMHVPKGKRKRKKR
jgi:NAD-dependent SIR2 family protein deacetylase